MHSSSHYVPPAVSVAADKAVFLYVHKCSEADPRMSSYNYLLQITPNQQGTLKKFLTELQCRNFAASINVQKCACNVYIFQLSFHFAYNLRLCDTRLVYRDTRVVWWQIQIKKNVYTVEKNILCYKQKN